MVWQAGSTWAMNPIPMCGQETTHTTDPSGNVHTCPGGTPANWTNFPYPAPGTSNITSFTIGDSLRIPEAVAPGEYLFQWRWDSEQTPQVRAETKQAVFNAIFLPRSL
jgi:hypothetical protein